MGPDLQGVIAKRDIEWLKRFIQTPSALIEEKDPTALALLEEYGAPMPDLGLSDEEVEHLIAFLRAAETGGAGKGGLPALYIPTLIAALIVAGVLTFLAVSSGNYRNRWSYDYSVRTAHGVNCSMACSWEVFVKDGMICWELQKVDYPQIEPDVPNVEPRGCQRGVTASWYPYSPLRPRYPYVRKVLWDMWQEERAKGKDPVQAWASIVENKDRAMKYKSARGKGGWKRVTWDEATEIVAAAQI